MGTVIHQIARHMAWLQVLSGLPSPMVDSATYIPLSVSEIKGVCGEREVVED